MMPMIGGEKTGDRYEIKIGRKGEDKGQDLKSTNNR